MSDLGIRVRLDDTGLDADLKGVVGKLKKATKAISAVALPVAGVAAIAKTIDGLAAIGEKAIQAAGDLNDFAGQLGVSAEKLQELRILAKDAGIEAGQLDSAIAYLNKTLGEAALGQGEFAKYADAAGLSIRDEVGNIKNAGQVWDELSEKVRSGTLSQEQSTALMAKAFGRSGTALVAVMKQTSDEQEKLIRTAREFGAIISNEVAAQADEYGSKLDLIKQGTEALSTQSALVLAPLTVKWAELKNEIAFTVAGLAEAAGLIENNNTLRQKELKNLELIIARYREHLQLNGLQEASDDNLRHYINRWTALRLEIEAASKASEEAANSGAVPSAGSAPVDTKAQEQAAKYELDLVTAVYEERDRLAQLEVEQNQEYLQAIQDERTRIQLEELEAERALVDAVLEERWRLATTDTEIFRQHQGWLTEIAIEAAKQREEFEKASSADKTKRVLGDLVSLTAGVAQHSKAMFNLNKAASLASAVMNTAEGVTQALKAYPPPFSFAMAAAQAAAGAAQISAIKATTFNGKGGGTTPSSAGTTPVVNGQPAAAPSQIIQVRGVSPDQLFTGRQLVDLLNAATKDGAKLHFTQ